jgi:superfamily I DNA/RNA helicase
MTVVTKIYGPPGTGKTEKLIRRAMAYIRIGTPVNKIGYFAFTRKAANEAKNRMLKKNPQYKKKQLRYFQTLHSLAFHSLGLREENVMQDYHYNDLGKELSIRVNAKKDADASPYLTCDNEYFQIILKAKEKNITAWQEYCTGEHSIDDPDLLKHIEANYNHYKHPDVNNLVDFTDMIHDIVKQPQKIPDFDVVFIDEAQDLSPIQWKLYDILKSKSKKIYLAGDDDQAIYGWAGADVDRFIQEPAKERVLSKSRRIPKSVQDISEIITGRIEGLRATKNYLPRDEEGMCSKINSLENVDLLQDQWLILTRTISRSKEICNLLKVKGLYYENKNQKSYNTKLYKAIINHSKWVNGETVSDTSLEDIKEYTQRTLSKVTTPPFLKVSQANIASKRLFLTEILLLRSYKTPINFKWFECFDNAPAEDKIYIRLMLSNKEKLSDNARIKVSTIHAAKGGECTNVILVLDNAKKIREATIKSIIKRDEEHRVWYVGCTRAKRNLYLMRAKIERKGYQL